MPDNHAFRNTVRNAASLIPIREVRPVVYDFARGGIRISANRRTLPVKAISSLSAIRQMHIQSVCDLF